MEIEISISWNFHIQKYHFYFILFSQPLKYMTASLSFGLYKNTTDHGMQIHIFSYSL